MSYRVDLPVFSGPMDLLLHLVRQQEVDIHAVSMARILDSYLKHLEVLRELDLADIGDFLVMASTLMEIKSRELLPRETVELEEELDPRDDLIQRLLQYKRYRDLARELEARGERRQLQSPLIITVPKDLGDEEDTDDLDLGTVGIWDLTEAFARLLEEIGGAGEMRVAIEKRDVSYYTGRLLARFKQRPELRFEDLFDRGEGRFGLIGTLMALLEMMKQGYARALQEQCFGPIYVAWRGGPDVTVQEIMSGVEVDAAAQAMAAEVLAEEMADQPAVATTNGSNRHHGANGHARSRDGAEGSPGVDAGGHIDPDADPAAAAEA